MPPLLTPHQGIGVRLEPSKGWNHMAVMNGEERYYSDAVFVARESCKALELIDSGLNPCKDTQISVNFWISGVPLTVVLSMLASLNYSIHSPSTLLALRVYMAILSIPMGASIVFSYLKAKTL